MTKKKSPNHDIPDDQKNSENAMSDEWQSFKEGVRSILSIPPEKAKEIREKYPGKGQKRRKTNS